MNRHPLLDLDRFDLLPSPPSGWHDYDYRLLDDGRLALVRVSTDLAAISPHDLARAWTKTRLRLSCFDGEAESDVLELPPVRWPKVDRLPDGRWLVVESRCSWSARNVSIFNSDGTRAESFSVGDSVGPVLYLPDGRLWVGYMDQAIFGDDPPGHPARSGLAAFDRSGACVWRFAHETYRICDCYALGATGTVLWAYTYVDFPLIRVNGEEVRMWRSSVDGVHAIAVNDSHVILAGGYSSDANRLVLLQLNDTDAVPIDEFRLETDGQKVTWRGRNGAMHAIVGRKWFQIPIDDWLIAVL